MDRYIGKQDDVIILKPGKIPKDWKKYSCKECSCQFAKPSWDIMRVNISNSPIGRNIFKFVRCPQCGYKIICS